MRPADNVTGRASVPATGWTNNWPAPPRGETNESHLPSAERRLPVSSLDQETTGRERRRGSAAGARARHCQSETPSAATAIAAAVHCHRRFDRTAPAVLYMPPTAVSD